MFPLLRGDKGVCYGEGAWCGWSFFCCCLARKYFLGFRWLLLILGSCAWASHTPDPSREGRFEMLVSF